MSRPTSEEIIFFRDNLRRSKDWMDKNSPDHVSATFDIMLRTMNYQASQLKEISKRVQEINNDRV